MEAMVNPFREPAENEEYFNELIKQQEVFPPIDCHCGTTYTTEMHTVCPNCYCFPKYSRMEKCQS